MTSEQRGVPILSIDIAEAPRISRKLRILRECRRDCEME